MSTFSLRLKQLRKMFKLTQQELADSLGTSKSSVNMYERGEREPGIDMISQIADFFFVNTDYLLGKSDTQNTEVKQNVKPGSEVCKIIKRISIELDEDYDKLEDLFITNKFPQALNYNSLLYFFSVYLGKPLCIDNRSSEQIERSNKFFELFDKLSPEEQEFFLMQLKGILNEKQKNPTAKGDGIA